MVIEDCCTPTREGRHYRTYAGSYQFGRRWDGGDGRNGGNGCRSGGRCCSPLYLVIVVHLREQKERKSVKKAFVKMCSAGMNIRVRYSTSSQITTAVNSDDNFCTEEEDKENEQLSVRGFCGYCYHQKFCKCSNLPTLPSFFTFYHHLMTSTASNENTTLPEPAISASVQAISDSVDNLKLNDKADKSDLEEGEIKEEDISPEDMKTVFDDATGFNVKVGVVHIG